MLCIDLESTRTALMWSPHIDIALVRESHTKEKVMEDGRINIDKFSGKDFGFWKMQMEDYLYLKGLHLPMEGTKPASMGKAEWDHLDRQALGAVRLTLAQNVAFNFMHHKTTKDLMFGLSNMYEKTSVVNKVYLMRRLFSLAMSDGGSVSDHINDFNMIVSQLSSVEINFDDEVKALILLCSLSETWDTIVVALSSSRGSGKLKFDEIRDVILSESIRKKEQGDSLGSGSALKPEGRVRNNFWGNSKHGRSKPRGRGKSQNRLDITCWNCGENGHFKNNCSKPKKKKYPCDDDDSVNSATEIHDALLLSVDNKIEFWILDTGASFHSTPCRTLFHNFVSGNFGKVFLADDMALDIMGKGDVNIETSGRGIWKLEDVRYMNIETSGRGIWKLEDVRYIPNLKRNLISVGQLDSFGYHSDFGDGKWKIVKGAMVIAWGTKTGTLYSTKGWSTIASVSEKDEGTSLWHNRLGHISEKGMKILATKEHLPGLKSVDLDMCESCIFEKQKRVSFTKAAREPKAKRLELVHMDVWGPSPIS